MRHEPVAHGVFPTAHRPRLVNPAARRVESLARPSHLAGRLHRCPHTRWPHRLTPSGEPLRVDMGRIGAELSPRRAGGTLRRLRPSGESGFAARSWAGQQGASLGMGGIYRLAALRLTAVPHGATAIAALEVRGVGRYSDGGGPVSPRILLS